MNLLVALGLSIGILAGAWTYVAGTFTALGLATVLWVGFVSWACFYAVGGKKEGLLKTVAANLSGVLWGFVAIQLTGIIAGIFGSFALAVAVGIGCFIMVIQANVKVLSFIPGAFAGAAAYFGGAIFLKADWISVVIALVAGAVLGYLSEVIGVALSNIGKKDSAAA